MRLAADRLKNAAATKKLAIFDAFEILKRIDLEAENILIESKVQTKLILNKDLQSEGQNSLYRIIKDYIPKQVRSKKNSGRTWLYGYNEKYDFVNISKTGKVGDVIEISGLKIGLPLKPELCDSRHTTKSLQYWERKELPKN